VFNLSIDADEDDTRLDRWLKRKFHGLTQGQIEKACRTGEIRVDGARAKANTRVKAGQSVRVPPMTAPKGSKPEDDDEKPRARVKSSDADMM
jgi:23S rRNA pseudouridine955/2504/2580 synthase